MATAKVALRPKSEAPRPRALAGNAKRDTTNYINGNETTDSTLTARLQFLSGLGLIGTRGLLLSGLIWEGANHA